MDISVKPLKASVAAVKRIPGWDRGGWGTFKIRLKQVLGLPQHVDVPQEWQEAFKKACGR